jgi:hypothetical protein
MCGREIFIDTLGKNATSDEVRKMLSYQTQQKSKITKVPKPEYILRTLQNFNKALFRFDENTDQHTPDYNDGGSVLYGVKSFLEYMYRKKFPIFTAVAPELYSRNNTYKLMFMSHHNEWCSNPIENTGGKDKKSEYYTKDVRNDRPEIVCVSISPSLSGMYFYDDQCVPNTIFDPKKKDCLIDGVMYVQDSIIISNHNTTESGGHAIAGITCGNKRYVYNGWTSLSTDPALQGKKMHNTTPCDLFPMDWLEEQDDFCISEARCDLPKVLDGQPIDLCFNFKKGFIFHLLYRKDIYDRAIEKLGVVPKVNQRSAKSTQKKSCKSPLQRDPITQRCKNIEMDVNTSSRLESKNNSVTKTKSPVSRSSSFPKSPKTSPTTLSTTTYDKFMRQNSKSTPKTPNTKLVKTFSLSSKDMTTTKTPSTQTIVNEAKTKKSATTKKRKQEKSVERSNSRTKTRAVQTSTLSKKRSTTQQMSLQTQ